MAILIKVPLELRNDNKRLIMLYFKAENSIRFDFLLQVGNNLFMIQYLLMVVFVFIWELYLHCDISRLNEQSTYKLLRKTRTYNAMRVTEQENLK